MNWDLMEESAELQSLELNSKPENGGRLWGKPSQSPHDPFCESSGQDLPEGKTIAQVLASLFKWASIPFLLVASVFSGLAAGYEPLVDVLVCMGAIILVQRAVWRRQYVLGTGFVAIVVAFSPLSLVVKIFLLLGLTCIAALIALIEGFRARPQRAV